MKLKSKIKILKELIKAMAIIALSSFPYIHDIITVRTGDLATWVPDLGIQDFLIDSKGDILGYSSYRVFLYMLLIHIFAHIGYVGWFFDAKDKLYRPFLLVPVILSLYQIILILFDARANDLNDPNTKFVLTIALSIILVINFFLNNKKMLTEHFLKHKNSPLNNQSPIQTEKEHIN